MNLRAAVPRSVGRALCPTSCVFPTELSGINPDLHQAELIGSGSEEFIAMAASDRVSGFFTSFRMTEASVLPRRIL
jgi:hypothetical protein